jgi:predicted DsbA family dithiol-disulfide isomerase
MKIDIISDTICPWCFIGKRRLEKALAARPQPDVKISWRPFQLNPEMPREGMDRQSYLAAKFGGADRASRQYGRIEEAGASEGIAFRFDGIRRTPNTVDSHRLVQFAGEHGRQDAVVEGLFRAYFIEGRDVGDVATMVEIAEAAGLPAAETEAFLKGDGRRDDVLAADQEVRMLGVTGVPCFIIEGKYAVSGAQSPEVFFQIFDLVREEQAENAEKADTAAGE